MQRHEIANNEIDLSMVDELASQLEPFPGLENIDKHERQGRTSQVTLSENVRSKSCVNSAVIVYTLVKL